MSTIDYRCKQHDVLDQICFDHYGQENGITEQVLALNHGLASHGTHLPMGLVIKLPVITQQTPKIRETIQLWD